MNVITGEKQSVVCPSCDKRLSAPVTFAGRTLKCPQCATKFICEFSAEPIPADIVHPRSGFRMIDVAPRNPKRSAATEMFRLGLGVLGAMLGAVVGIVVWILVAALTGFNVAVVGVFLIGGFTGLGMRLAYGRASDFAAAAFAFIIALVGFVFGWLAMSTHHTTTRGLAICAALSAVLALCVAYGIGWDGETVD